ncbi:MAG TPA: Gfo/Idh/MocA family oxidoreductase, partial [Rhizomicrobium sp.]|nr:Gfo/Idh/MocA family oxidoreductase [Rhizomicrobium sp.]
MIRVAVIGAGAFGKNHVRVVGENPRAEIAMVIDKDPSRAPVSDFRQAIGKVDAAIVAAPTVAHAEIACALLEAGIDVLIEKPIAATLEEADRIVEAAERNRRIAQVGHLERFNPAILAVEKLATV